MLADTHGNVVVVGTRDCSLQRRNQKLVEEAPAPFLTDEQRARIHSSAKDIVRGADYVGAGTVEYLVGAEGDISFLEVNTRLQVEHPVSEETSGLDLVRQQFRIAEGLPLEITEDPTPRGHSIEFRINAEDAGRNFMPAPGPVTALSVPQGPGVRWDSGVVAGGEVAGAFDSMLAKLIVTGATRAEALQRAARALDELVVEGMPTVIPFHGRWCGTRRSPPSRSPCTPGGSRPSGTTRSPPTALPPDTRSPRSGRPSSSRSAAGGWRSHCRPGSPSAAGPRRPARRPSRASGAARSGGGAASGESLTSPMQGTIVKVAVEDGATVAAGDLVVVLEAMKMEQPIVAHKAGTVPGSRPRSAQP